MTNTNDPNAMAEAIAAAVKAALGEEVARKEAKAQKQKQYRDKKKTERKEASGKELVRRCEDLGLVMPQGIDVDENGNIKNTLANCIHILESQPWRFSFDQLAQTCVFRGEVKWPAHYGTELTDDLVRVLRFQIIDVWDVEFSTQNVVDSLLVLCRAAPFHPVVEYLNGLKWDGVKRLDGWLTTYLGTPDNTYTRAVGTKWMLGAVARAKQPGCKFDQMLILEGPQGSEKSTAIATLAGEQFFSDAELGNVRDKDAVLVLQGAWIQEMAEMATMTKSDVNDQKGFISRRKDKFRPPYGRAPVTLPRGFILVGTINPGGGGYFIDQTGNRRYWPVVTGVIDLDGLRRDRDQLWAETVARYKNGESLVLPKELWTIAAAEQDARRVSHPWEDEIEAWVATVTANTCFTHNDSSQCFNGKGDCVHLAADCFGKDGKLQKIHSRDLLSKCLAIPRGLQNTAHGKQLKTVMAAKKNWTYHPQLRIGDIAGIGGYQRDD